MFLSEAEVNKVVKTVKGITPEDAVLTDMKRYFHDKYDIEILDYICSTEEFGPPGNKSKRAEFVVWDITEAEKCPTAFDMKVRDEVKRVFAKACREHGLHQDFYDPSKFFPNLTDIESDITDQLIRKKRGIIDHMLRCYPQIRRHQYSGTCVHVFYETDKDIAENEKSGLSSEIRYRVSDILGEYEGFEGRKLGVTVFTSLQTLREKYDNNTYWYFHG